MDIERRSFLKGSAALAVALAGGARLSLLPETALPSAAATPEKTAVWLANGDTLSVYYPDGEVLDILATGTMRLTVDEHGFIEEVA